MADNEIRTDLTGDSSDLEQAFDRTGDASRQMAQQVGTTEAAFDSAARGAGRLGAALDMASGAGSQLSGGIGDIGGAMTAFTDLQDLAANKALEQEAALLAVEKAQKAYDDAVKASGAGSMEAREAMLALKQAQAAAEPPTAIAEWGEKLELISPIVMGLVGATDLLILANTAASASFIKTAATATASAVAAGAKATAVGIATAAQWLWNIAMTANPIGLIIVAIAALVAGIIWVATKTTWFQDLWSVTWGAIKGAALATWHWIRDTLWPGIVGVASAVGGAFSRIPGLISSAFSGLVNIITWPFRTAFNFVARAWNNTIGQLHWSVPSWVPGIGGNSIGAPHLPTFHKGGTVPGAPGQEMLAVLQAGERVIPAGGDGGRTVLELRSGGSRLDDLLVEILARAIGERGGDVQLVLGGRRG